MYLHVSVHQVTRIPNPQHGDVDGKIKPNYSRVSASLGLIFTKINEVLLYNMTIGTHFIDHMIYPSISISFVLHKLFQR